MNRRSFLSAVASACSAPTLVNSFDIRLSQLLCTSQGKTVLMNADGSGRKVLEFDRPGQATWQPGPFLSDGRLVLLSMEPRRDGPGRPFEEFYTQTPTHLWLHDLDTGALEEIAHKERIAVFYTPALLIGDGRILVQVVKDRVGQIVSMNLDGTDAKPFTQPGEGLPYGLSLSPDRKRVAYHLASPRGYEVWTSDPLGKDRIKLAGQAGHLYFGTSWSPDGKWVAYQDCLPGEDPGHDWSDVCVGRPDGTEHRVLTQSRRMWFGASYGNDTLHGGGSNIPAWTADGYVLFPRRSDGAQVPMQYRVGQADVDHYNRAFRPEQAKGGTQICTLNPANGMVKELTPIMEGVWDFRARQSPDGKQIVFCRAKSGEMPSLWVMRPDGKGAKKLWDGIDGKGVDHPVWRP